ncbi:MAG: glycosyltransferase family 4 protein [Bacteroidota bacterium]
MKISLLVHNLSGNNLVRVYPIAKTLERFCTVEILGFSGPEGVFAPYRNEFRFEAFPMPTMGTLASAFRAVAGRISGDILYAFKPNPLSFGVGLFASKQLRLPLVLDIEDFDIAFQIQRGFWGIMRNVARVWDIQSLGYATLTDLLTSLAGRITVGSTFLQRRYGGVIVPHGADTSVFDPAAFNSREIRSRWGFDDEFIILFAGKPSEHKGLDSLTRIVVSWNNRRSKRLMRLLVVGGAENDAIVVGLKKTAGECLVHLPYQPHDRMPEILSLADTVVLPQKKTLYTQAQIPGKLYEAMAMEKAIVATAVSDLPRILDGCGIIVQPDSPAEFGEAVGTLYDNPQRAKQIGRAARKQCEKHYSWNAMQPTLEAVFNDLRQ